MPEHKHRHAPDVLQKALKIFSHNQTHDEPAVPATTQLKNRLRGAQNVTQPVSLKHIAGHVEIINPAPSRIQKEDLLKIAQKKARRPSYIPAAPGSPSDNHGKSDLLKRFEQGDFDKVHIPEKVKVQSHIPVKPALPAQPNNLPHSDLLKKFRSGHFDNVTVVKDKKK